MAINKSIRNLIIGKNVFIESHGEYKQVMLSGQFALIGILLCSIYIVIESIFGTYETLLVFAPTITLFVLSVGIHRRGKHCLANYFLLPTANITVYLIAASESPNTGVFIFFMVTSLAAFAVFNFKQRLLSILFAVFTYFLFVMAYFVDYSLLPKRDYTSDYILLNMVVNFSIALPASVMAMYLMISLNYKNSMQLVENNRLLIKTNGELDRFVYSTSHDLRAPLASVLGLIDIAERSGNLMDVTRYLSLMRDRVHSLDKFIKDITDYSRNNRLAISKEMVNLGELAKEVWETLKYMPEAQLIDFKMEIPGDVAVATDKNRLKIILSNLMANSIRYHDVQKTERFIRMQHQMNGQGFYLKVEDNGQGIHPDYHTKIFDMFYRANEKSKGSGLGLYIVKETLTKLSGTIHLDSAPGVGTVFTLKLPY